jgi:hypothetical protein
MNRQSAVCSNNGVTFSLKSGGNPVTCHSINKPWRHYAKLNKSVTKGQLVDESSYMSQSLQGGWHGELFKGSTVSF